LHQPDYGYYAISVSPLADFVNLLSGAERLTKASGWYPWHREEVYHGDH